jgi:dolichyl-phosphate-mannose--protein O-mannosyl transferase
MSWAFAPLAYGSYLIMWVPVRRFLMIYDYMPMCEIGIVAVARVLTANWQREAQTWEQSLLLVPASAVRICALHGGAGIAAAGGTVAVWSILIGLRNNNAGRFVCIVVMLLTVVTFAYFYPLWSGMALSHTEHLGRMWFRGPGLPNWT